jgi:hypothetical protein
MDRLINIIIDELQLLSTDEKLNILPRFFKTGKGEYGEGDKFLGVSVPDVRKVAKNHKNATINELTEMMQSEWHEVRLCSLLIMVEQFKKTDDEGRKRIVNFYLSVTNRINNWDLVDLSCPAIIGEYLLNRSHDLLYRLAESSLLWENRIAIVSTIIFIRQGQLDDTFNLSTKMMNHPHDLMHKAIGWMLREAGKRDEPRLYNYVKTYRLEMPRTMLRYAIEKFDKNVRAELMNRDI